MALYLIIVIRFTMSGYVRSVIYLIFATVELFENYYCILNIHNANYDFESLLVWNRLSILLLHYSIVTKYA